MVAELLVVINVFKLFLFVQVASPASVLKLNLFQPVVFNNMNHEKTAKVIGLLTSTITLSFFGIKGNKHEIYYEYDCSAWNKTQH